ncbi:hypothetical protein HDV01_006965 [Terramyces sp. JEL0728]|nr:hypothetical protein HDV01_006965 [Terramyces sp. JEL0728]
MSLVLLCLSTVLASSPSFVTVKSITYGGSGCTPGSTAAVITPDLNSFELQFNELIATSGNGTSLIESRKNCQLNIALDYQQGYQFRLVGVDYTGHVSVPSGQTVIEQSSFYFQGKTQTASVQSQWKGPVEQDFQLLDIVPSNQLWSDCTSNRNLNINTQVRIATPSAAGPYTSISVDTMSGFALQSYKMEWKPC